MTDTAAARLSLGPIAALVDVLGDGILVVTVDGTVCLVNPSAERMLARRADELVGRSIRSGLPNAGGLPSFLTRAGGPGTPATWSGHYAPTGAFLSATAVQAGHFVQVALREEGAPLSERRNAAVAGSMRDGATPDGGVPSGVLDSPAGADDALDGDLERERLRYLAFVTETMIGTLNTGEAATRLAELVVPRLCDWAVVTVTGDDGRAGQEGRAHCDPAREADVEVYREGRLPVTSPHTPMAAALLTGKPVRLAQLDQTRIAPTLTNDRVRAAWQRLGTTSATIVPLRARGETFGALAMMNAGARPPQTSSEVATAVEVARRGALALDNARLYGRQLDVAETLQRSLLTPPTHSDPDHLQIAVRYRPAASHQAVGGDWYDAFQQPDGATELVIGDVVGHNVEATAAMSQIRSMLRALAHDQPGSPAHILTRLDRLLTGLHVDKMATALVARVEQPAELTRHGLRTLRWSSAGHVPPLLLQPDGRVRVLETVPERLLGTGWAGTRYDHTILLHPGDTVLLVTDGLIEHGRCEFDRGMTRLTAALAKLDGLPVEELCDQLLDRVIAGRPDDDIAILALRCNRQPD